MKKTVTLKMDPTGDRDRSQAVPMAVEAEVRGPWAVHGVIQGRGPDEWAASKRGAWTITHVEVGSKLPVEITHKAAAVSFAQHLRDVAFMADHDAYAPPSGARLIFERHLYEWADGYGFRAVTTPWGYAVFPAENGEAP